jgi:hypothetical protein
MELQLNLAWLLLTLPAYWLWRVSRTTHATRKFRSLQCLLAIGCMLVVLFPVVSATDDLCAMRAEMEESPSSKRTVRHTSNDKASAGKLQIPPSLACAANQLLIANDEDWHQLPVPDSSVPAPLAVAQAGRAPPDSFPG